ncbi:MAG: sulfatase-like hydrolase/transferase [Planctomycetes bacterium]|nr:sulfatase-like hydrolase/transferase [Planctomycetota bacterium]
MRSTLRTFDADWDGGPLVALCHTRLADQAVLVIIGLLGLCLTQTGFAGDSVPAQRRARTPNIVLLFVDDLGYGETGCQGNDEIPTPNIDSIAANGVRSGYVTASYCSPSRAGLLTGRYQNRFGYERNPIGAANEDPEVGLPASERTLAQHLHDFGYATALIGKWHLGAAPAYHPLRRGFDEFFGFLHEGHYYVPPPYRGVVSWLRRRRLPGGGTGRWINGDRIYSTHMGHDEPPYDANNLILRGGQPVLEPSYLTDAFTREAIDFIRRHRRQPFFLYVAYNAVHSPMQATHAYIERFRHIEDIHRRVFAAMLAHLDDSIGKILKTLREAGLEQDTLVFFLSDNGGPTRELTSSNRPLRGGKGDLYEGGIRVPFLLQWKGHVPAGLVYQHPVISLDVFATAAAATGTPPSDRKPIDGVDLLPYLIDQRAGRPHEVLYWRMNQRAALRLGDWKLVRNPRGQRDAPWELYSLADDLGETHNLSEAEPQRLKQMIRTWERLDRQIRNRDR